MKQAMRRASLLCLLLAGCTSIGPQSVPRDRFDYVASISESAKRQILLNLLKVRYADAPVFLDVSSVINAYTLETTVDVFGQSGSTAFTDSFRTLGAGARYADQPTITYTPLSGDKFARSIMSPIPVSAVLLLAQGGYPLDVVLRFCAISINGLDNSFGGYAARAGDPRFHELLDLVRGQQVAGRIEIRARGEGEDKQDIVWTRRPPVDDAMAARQARFAALLGISPDKKEYRVTAGAFAARDDEIAIQTRSILQVLIDLASYIDVPPGDAAGDRVHVPQRTSEQERMFPALLRISHADAVPRDAYAAVRYRERWFWIDDRDRASKAAFSFLMVMLLLTHTETQPGPVVTIPAR
jgi:hypothetical protein